MSSFHEFHEPIAVETPLGRGHAVLIERTPHDYLWTVVLNETGAPVAFTQDRIRFCKSYTYRRGISDEQMRDIIKPAIDLDFEEKARRKQRAWDQAVKDIAAADAADEIKWHPGEVKWQHP